jgi:hypothetical protein
MIDIIKDWLDALTDFATLPDDPRFAYVPKHKLPPRVRSITCMAEACTFVKCYADDVRCAYPADIVDERAHIKWPLQA